MPLDFIPTDQLLLRLQGTLPAVKACVSRLPALPVYQTLACSLVRWVWHEQSTMAYVYLCLPCRLSLSMDMLAPMTAQACPGGQVTVSRLTWMDGQAGAAGGQRPSFHYVVETTPEPGWELELQHWYAKEHLPGLARVPGCVQAQRFWNQDAGPRSFACYDLVDGQVLDSPAWLAVRHTAWSSRVRPHFTHTVRTLFTVVA